MAKPYVIGIDMGGTNTAFGLVDARGNVIASSSIKTAKHSDINDYIDELYEAITRILEENNAVGKVQGIGIGAPNSSYYTGMIEDTANLPWPCPIPLAQLITDKFGMFNDYSYDTRCQIMAGVEKGLLAYYTTTPLYYRNVASLYSMQVNNAVNDYQQLVGFGGMAFMTYNYDDAAWAEYCANNTLAY